MYTIKMKSPKKPGKYQDLDYIDSIIPSNVKIKRPIPDNINIHKEMSLIFIDEEFGEFITSIRGLVDAGKSTHPKRTGSRRAITNKAKSQEEKNKIINKRQETMLQRGNDPSNKERLEKRKMTFLTKYGVTNPMQLPEVRDKVKNTLKNRYGISNPMFREEFKQKLVDTCLRKYGVTNGGGSSVAIEKILKAHTENADTGSSKLELDLLNWINSFGFNAKKGYIGKFEFDIKIEELKLLIEFNGSYWHSDLFRDRQYHISKTTVAENAGYRLIHIFDYEWIKRKEQVKSFLKSILGKNSIKLHARKCEIKLVSKKDANDFLNKYHILGQPNQFKVSYGLYYFNELVSLITLGNHHRKGCSELVLSRYCGKYDVSVAGGLSRLTKYAKINHGEISTWVDRRISNGDNWTKSGWELVKTLAPDYFYYNPKTKEVISKQSRQKRKIHTEEGMTESEHAILDGLLKIWDCGKKKFIVR